MPPPFAAPSGQRIGEILFAPSPELDGLLVKYIFTEEALSVQVHPSDAQAQALGLGQNGKDECWLITDAKPGAVLGIGLVHPMDTLALCRSAHDGSIVDLLAWHPVSAGDFFYIPAGTIHAIGAGVSLIEVQQNSDITFRLHDYGRPRELHVEQAVTVANGACYPAELKQKITPGQSARLVESPTFRLDFLCEAPTGTVIRRYSPGPLLAIPLTGHIRDGQTVLAPGECGIVPVLETLRVPDGASCLIAQPC